MKKLLAALVLICFAAAASAQDPSYLPWRPAGDASASTTEELLRELTDMTNAAERDRAASPGFLADLRSLIARYSEAWPVVWFRDDFADGNFTAAPAWSVLSGYWVADSYAGLRSDARPVTEEPGSPTPEQVALGVLGALLSQQGTQAEEPASAAAPRSPSGDAAIDLPRPLSNAFSIALDVVDHAGSGVLEARLYQTATREPGYRMVYRASADPSFALYRRSRSGMTMIGRTSAPNRMIPGIATLLVWSRDRGGQMTVSVDGEIVLQATDTLFRDDWDGFLLRNTGGDFSIGSVTAAGTG